MGSFLSTEGGGSHDTTMEYGSGKTVTILTGGLLGAVWKRNQIGVDTKDIMYVWIFHYCKILAQDQKGIQCIVFYLG